MISRIKSTISPPFYTLFILPITISSKWEIKMAWYNGGHVLRGGRLSKMVVVMTTAQCIEEKYIRFSALRRREWIRVEASNEEKLVKAGKKRKGKNSSLPSLHRGGPATLPSSFSSLFQSLSLRTIPSAHLSHHLSDFESWSIIFRGN